MARDVFAHHRVAASVYITHIVDFNGCTLSVPIGVGPFRFGRWLRVRTQPSHFRLRPFDLQDDRSYYRPMARTADPTDIPQRLVKAGLELFLRKGYNASGIQQITDHAGVPKGSFYNHFDSKEAFAAVVVDRYAQHMKRSWERFMEAAPAEPLAAIRHVFDQMLELSRAPILLSHSGARAVFDHPRNLDDGRLRLIATFNEQRSERWPTVPTLRELGYDIVTTSPYGIGQVRAPASGPTPCVSAVRSAAALERGCTANGRRRRN